MPLSDSQFCAMRRGPKPPWMSHTTSNPGRAWFALPWVCAFYHCHHCLLSYYYPVLLSRLSISIPSALPSNPCSWATACFLGRPLSPAISNIRMNLHMIAEPMYREQANLAPSEKEIKSREARMAAPMTSCIKDSNTPAMRVLRQYSVNPWSLKLFLTRSISSILWFAQISNSINVQDLVFLVSIAGLVRFSLFEILKRTMRYMIHIVSAQAGI